jgi:glycosyltransferase involved in cell wall biosynthesis
MRGGVADYSEDLLPHLAAYCDIDIYTRDGLAPDNKALARSFQIYGHAQFLDRDGQEAYDQVIYQLGCSGDHVPDYENLLRRPGLCVLHELNLAGIIGARTFGRGRPRDYVRAVLQNEGLSQAAWVIWNFARTRTFPDYLKYEFSRVALKHSQGLIVHNEFMRRRINDDLIQYHLQRPIYQIRMGIPPAAEVGATDLRAARGELGADNETFVIGSFGVVHESKGVLTALRAFKRLLERIPNSLYVFVGRLESSSLPGVIEEMGLTDRVRMTGFVSMSDYYRYAAAIDVGINLRVPQTGGTSSALLRLLGVGRPTIISDHAQFAELPDEVCLKAETGEAAEESVLAHLIEVANQPERARRIGENARRFIAQAHSLDQSARGYRDAIQDSIRARPRVAFAAQG